ncbi:MAG: Glutaredoxin [Thermoleophilaceae bacterium]|jgi:glutaredoxin 3|nr:Glutaredoxin [Thermoleophilaceae bacterium]
MADRIMYVKPGCPYCESARGRLRQAGLEWEERDATTNPDWKSELFMYSPRGVVPTLVEGGAITIGHDGKG